MTDVFVSYARPTAQQAHAMAELLRANGFSVWRDDDLPPHRPFGDVIEERLREAAAVLVLWSADAAKSQWVRAEAEMAREAGKLVQLTLDGAPLPLPFSQTQCADMIGWTGNPAAPALRKVLESVTLLVRGRPGQEASPPIAHPGHGVMASSLTGPATVAVRTTGAPFPLADELAAELAASIGRHSGLVVRDRPGDSAEYVVEIQARQAGPRIRATARLLAADGTQLWSDRFEGSAEELFELEDRVTELVTASVEAHVRRARIAQASTGGQPDTPESRILLATTAGNRMQREGYREAIALLQPVIAAAPDTANALAILSLAHGNLWYNGHLGSTDADRQASIDYARRALRITDSEPFPAGISAVMLACCGEPVEPCIALADRVRAFAPGFAPAHLWSGQVRLIAGRLDEAATHLEAARRLDQRMSVRPILLGVLGAVRMLEGRPADAVALLLEAEQLAGEIPMNNLLLAASLGLQGREAEGRKALARAAEVAPPGDFRFPFTASHKALLAQALADLS